MTEELSEAEAVQVAAFGLDKKPDAVELALIAFMRMHHAIDRCIAAVNEFRSRS